MTKRNVIVTGASSGIGFEISRLLVKKRYFVLMLGRDSQRLLKAQSLIDPTGQSTKIISCDLSQPLAIERSVELISQEDQIDGLINAAGIGYFTEVLETSNEEIAQTFQTNTLGLIYLTKGIAKLMVRQNSGHIINIASMAGKITTPKAAVYGSSKAAVIAFSNGIRLELRHYHIYVSTVSTGPVATPFLSKADPSGKYEESVSRYILPSKVVANKIVRLLERYQREVNLPWYMEGAARLYPFASRFGDYLAGVVFNKK